MLLDEVDTAIEVVTAEEKVIKQRRNLRRSQCSQRCEGCSGRECDEGASSKRFHFASWQPARRFLAVGTRLLRAAAWGRGRLCCGGGWTRCLLRPLLRRPRACKE